MEILAGDERVSVGAPTFGRQGKYKMRRITKIYIHCSASLWGNVKEIRRWHVEERNFSDIGYHYLITNQFPTYGSLKDDKPDKASNGKVWAGRPVKRSGAHVKFDNRHSIGICLVGVTTFTPEQLVVLALLVKRLMLKYDVKIENVLGHYEYWTKKGMAPKKACPNIDMGWFRSFYSEYLEVTDKKLAPLEVA